MDRANKASIYFNVRCLVFLCVVCLLIIYAWSREPYSTEKDPIYKHHMKTAKYGIDFYVKSGFNKKHPVGSPARVELENKVIKEFNETEQWYCRHELWHKWLSAVPEYYPTPECDKLLSKGIPIPTTSKVTFKDALVSAKEIAKEKR
nr:chaperone protein DnaJ 49-like [Tanacetum cinerariifolium]